MPIIELPSDDWDYDNLDRTQELELYATLYSHIAFPTDEKLRLGYREAIFTTLAQWPSDQREKELLHCVLSIGSGSTGKEVRHRITVLHKITSIICRMIANHNDQPNLVASRGKAIFLARNWFARKGYNRGYKDTTLRNLWQNYKPIAPLATAIVIERNRVRRSVHTNSHDNSPTNLKKKELAEEVTAVTEALSSAISIQTMLSNYSPSNDSPPVLAQDDLLFASERLQLTPRKIRWKPLRQIDLAPILDGTYKAEVAKKNSSSA